MPKLSRTGSTLKQIAYAKRIWSAQGKNKKEIALDVGYSKGTANSTKTKIENKRGFNNAMSALALESNSLALAAMAEFKARGFEDFSNKDLVGALNAIGNAWAKFNAMPKDQNDQNSKLGRNKLRTVILERVGNKTIRDAEVYEEKQPEENEEVGSSEEETVSKGPTEEDMDF